jgi:ribose-phosphate pyrophosphokinase
MPPLLFNISCAEGLDRSLAKTLGAELGHVETKRFPDGESYVRFESDLSGRMVLLLCTLDHPDEKILPLLYAASTARDLGAVGVGFICPYLAYMRQDCRFHAGEAVTSEVFARLLSHHGDWLVTVDPHLHRRRDLSVIYSVPTRALHTAPLIAAWIREHVANPLLIGPDSESEQWVSAVAKTADAPFTVLEKIRHGDRDVEVSVPEISRWKDHTPILVDDIASTARTMIETVSHLRATGLAPPVCIAVHGLFAGTAFADLTNSGVKLIVTTNTVPHETNAIDVSGILAKGINSCLSKLANQA